MYWKKISLVKLQGALLKQTQGSGGKNMPVGKLTLSDEDRSLLDKLIKDGDNEISSEDSYKL